MHKGKRREGWKVRIFPFKGKNIHFSFLQSFSLRVLLTKQNAVFLVLYGIF